MPDVAIITAIYGEYDELQLPLAQQGIDVEWVLVTDSMSRYMEYDLIHSQSDMAQFSTYGSDIRWRVEYVPRPDTTPFRAAKYAKFHPWEFTDASASIWIDGSVKIHSRNFAAEAMALANPLAQFRHWRDCIYEEIDASAIMTKYVGEPLREQADAYRAAGHPEHWGLWATTVLARKHTAQIVELGEQWQIETDAWTTQDQVSQPFVLRNLGLRPALFPGDYCESPAHGCHGNKWMTLVGSDKHRAMNTLARKGSEHADSMDT